MSLSEGGEGNYIDKVLCLHNMVTHMHNKLELDVVVEV